MADNIPGARRAGTGRTVRLAGARHGGVEDAINALAGRQHGVVARAQLLAAGISEQALDRRLKARRLRPLHRGVYLVGPLLVPRAQAMAAVLACGEGAVLSHRSAAGLWELLPGVDRRAPIEVIIARGDHRRPHIRIYRTHTVRPDEVTTLEQIPVTTPARTLLDLAAVAQPRELERALAEAFAKRLASRARLLELLSRHGRPPGVSRLRSLLRSGELALTRSEAEDRFLALVRKAQLPAPEVNTVVVGHEVDFYWRTERLVAEVDGLAFHSSAARFESDRRRDGGGAPGWRRGACG